MAVSVIRAMIASGDVVLAAVVTRGNDVVNVVHLRRAPTAFQATALQWRDPVCTVVGCNRAFGLERDHREDWATSRVTMLAWLDRLWITTTTSRPTRAGPWSTASASEPSWPPTTSAIPGMRASRAPDQPHRPLRKAAASAGAAALDELVSDSRCARPRVRQAPTQRPRRLSGSRPARRSAPSGRGTSRRGGRRPREAACSGAPLPELFLGDHGSESTPLMGSTTSTT